MNLCEAIVRRGNDEWEEDDPSPAQSRLDAGAERQAAGARGIDMSIPPVAGVSPGAPMHHHVMSTMNHPSVVMHLPASSSSHLHHAAAMGVHQQRALEDDDDDDDDEEEEEEEEEGGDADSDANGSKGLRHSISVVSEGEGSDFDRGWVDMVQQEIGTDAVRQDDWPA